MFRQPLAVKQAALNSLLRAADLVESRPFGYFRRVTKPCLVDRMMANCAILSMPAVHHLAVRMGATQTARTACCT